MGSHLEPRQTISAPQARRVRTFGRGSVSASSTWP